MESKRYIKVEVRDLRIGMYVMELDRPWMDTPFLVQGFVVKSVQELEALSGLCQHVYVDTGRSRPFHKPARNFAPRRESLTKERLEEMLNVRITPYQDSASFASELVFAKRVFNDFDGVVTRLYDDLIHHQRLNVTHLREPVNNIVESLVRNPDACTLLTKLRHKGDYTYNHAIGSSIWAAAMGRQLGLPRHVLVSLAIGALLLDVGKLRVPDRILGKAGPLTPAELDLVKKHVDAGLEMIKDAKGVDKIACQMVLTHHERHKGAGYPHGLAGKDIPVYGRIAGIVDTYDALINKQPYRPARAAAEAIRILYNVREVDFQGELVEEFIQALGVYPAGSLVELSNGEVGIVVGEHRHRRLRPRLLILLDAGKKPFGEKKYLDLFKVSHDDTGEPLEIRKSLTPGDYGLATEDILI